MAPKARPLGIPFAHPTTFEAGLGLGFEQWIPQAYSHVLTHRSLQDAKGETRTLKET